MQELKLAPTDLNNLVEEMCDFYEPQASTQGIVVRTHFAPDLPRLLMDADLFKQALLNLMLNAEHAMTEGGELILTTRLENGSARARRDRHRGRHGRRRPRQDLRSLLLHPTWRKRPRPAHDAEDRRSPRRRDRRAECAGQGFAVLAAFSGNASLRAPAALTDGIIEYCKVGGEPVIELPYSLIIEATEEPDFFGFYSPDLEGFTGIGHSVEDCLFQAKWGMQEFVQVMVENNMAIPPASKDPTITIKNMSRIETSQDPTHQTPPAERLALSN